MSRVQSHSTRENLMRQAKGMRQHSNPMRSPQND